MNVLKSLLLAAALGPAANAAVAANAPAADVDAAAYREFPGWEITGKAVGDLHGGGAADAAAILFKAGTKDEKGAALVVIFLDRGHGRLQLHTRAGKATCVGCGGAKAAWDAPMGGLSIRKGTLIIRYEGGSREIFDETFKWRLDRARDRFVLIGATSKVVDTIGEEPDEILDVNYPTRRMIRRIGKKSRTCPLDGKSSDRELGAFDYEAMHEVALRELADSCPP